jgi:hypothetical protein
MDKDLKKSVNNLLQDGLRASLKVITETYMNDLGPYVNEIQKLLLHL